MSAPHRAGGARPRGRRGRLPARRAASSTSSYFDPCVKRARIENADPETLDYVPPWYGERLLGARRARAARGSRFAGIVEPDALDGSRPGACLGRDRLPWLKEVDRSVIDERSTNWTIVPCPHPRLGAARLPRARRRTAAYERLWQELWHILRLDEPDPVAAWERAHRGAQGVGAGAQRARASTRSSSAGPGTELTVGLLPGVAAGRPATSRRAAGIRHLPNLPTEEVFTTPDPLRTEGHVTSTRPLVLKDGAIVRGLRVRFEAGRAVEVDADENGAALRGEDRARRGRRAARRGGARRPARAGSARSGPSSTTRCSTRTPRATSRSGTASPPAAGEEDASASNRSGDPHRLHDRLARARGDRRDRRRRASPGAPRRRLADLARPMIRGRGLDLRAAASVPRSPRYRASEREVAWNLTPPLLVHAGAVLRRGCARRGRTARRGHGPAHRPLARGQVHRLASPDRSSGSGGARATGRLRRSATTPCGRRSAPTSPGAGPTSSTPLLGADPAHRIAVRVVTSTAYHALFCTHDVHQAER